MATYLIESYLARARAGDLETLTSQLREAIARGGRGRSRMLHVRSYFLPDDETCFHVVEAPSAAAVRDVAQRAGLVADRIVEAAASSSEVRPAHERAREPGVRTAGPPAKRLLRQ